jgi:hypothetical protein
MKYSPILLCCWLFVSLPALAQNNDPLGGRDTIVLENERLQDVIDSDKPFYKADYQEISTEADEQLTYESEAFYVETDFEPAPPQVKPLQPEPPTPGFNNLIRVGIGRFVTPLAQVFLHNGPESDVDYGLNFTHRSAYRDRITLRRFKENYGGISGRLQNDAAVLSGGLDFYQTGYFNYAGDTLYDLGAALTDSLTEEGIQQRVEDSLRMGFFHLQAQVNVGSRSNQNYDYLIGARVRVHTDRRDNQEVHLSALPQGSINLTETFKLGIGGELTYVRGRIDTFNQNRLFFNLLPKVSFANDRVQASLGVNYAYFSNSTAENNQELLAPDIYLNIAAIPGVLDIFAGYDGTMKHQHYYGMIAENPYLAPNVEIKPTRTNLNLYAGVDGNLGKKLNLAGRVYYQRIQDQLIYRTADSIFFRPVYDSLMTVTGTHLEVNFVPGGNFSIGAALNLNVYQTSNQDSLTPRYFHAAPLRLDLLGTYRLLDDQLTLKGSFSLLGPTPMSVDSVGEIINRNSFFGVNVHGNYQITPNFSVFLAVDNLLGIRYQEWYYYPERQFDIRGGLAYTF